MSTLTNLLIILAIVFIILRISKKSKKKKRRQRHPYQATRRAPYPPRTAPVTPPPRAPAEGTDAFRRRAIELERLGRYQEAAEMYIKAGEIFSAAKAIASQGPEYVPQAVRIIETYAPNRTEMVVRNLVRYFFDKGELQTAANLFHEIGLHGEAEAIEALLPKRPAPPPTQAPPEIPPAGPIPPSSTDPTKMPPPPISPPPSIEPTPPTTTPSPTPIITPPEQQVKLSQPVTSEKPLAEPGKTKGPLMASTDLEESCMLCRKKIKAGEVYLKCPYCQNIYHRSHLLEWIKVKGTCPVCKHKLTAEMFES